MKALLMHWKQNRRPAEETWLLPVLALTSLFVLWFY